MTAVRPARRPRPCRRAVRRCGRLGRDLDGFMALFTQAETGRGARRCSGPAGVEQVREARRRRPPRAPDRAPVERARLLVTLGLVVALVATSVGTCTFAEGMRAS